MALTQKQERFVTEYVKTHNGTESARLAGYIAPHVAQSRLLKSANIAAEVAKRQAERAKRTNVTMDYVLTRLAVEAEREDDKATHSARVAALAQLRQHLEFAPETGDDTPSLNINITANEPVRSIRVTKG